MAQDFKQLSKLLGVMGQLLVIEARKNLTAGKKNASYKLANTLRYAVQETPNGVELQLIMPDYGAWVITGRKPGEPAPPVQDIKKWILDKNLGRKFLGLKGNQQPKNPIYDSQLEFIASKIAKKIGAKGLKGFNFLKPFNVTFIGGNIELGRLILPKEYLKQLTDEYKKITKELISVATYRQLISMSK